MSGDPTRVEMLTRLRNAFAHAAIGIAESPGQPTAPRVFAPPFSSMTEADWRQAVALWRGHARGILADAAPRPCPACGSAVSRFLFESYDAHAYHECEDCGCWFVPQHIDTRTFERLFERSPDARALATRMMQARDVTTRREADLSRIGAYLDELQPVLTSRDGAPIAYLDMGCGVGHSLRAGLARGWLVQGVESDPIGLALARAGGLAVAGDWESVPSGPYDLLSFWETLEHIADPLAVLQRFVPLIARHGIVAITVPNMQSPAARILRESCSWIHGGYNTPGHLNLFNAAALQRLLQRAGLTLLEADGQFSNDPVELVSYLLCQTRGAFDSLRQAENADGIGAEGSAALMAVWPGAALIERLVLASPILKVIACRRGHEDAFAEVMARRRRERHDTIVRDARALIDQEPDYKAMAQSLQREVDRRDELLGDAAAAHAREVGERDRLLHELEGHLHAAQDRFNRTVEGRLRRWFGLFLRKLRRQ